MKNLLPLLLFCLTIPAIGQDIEYIISERWKVLLTKVLKQDNKIFLGGAKGNCPQGTLFAFNEDGNKIWENSISDNSIITDMIFSSSDSLIIAAYKWEGLDVIDTSEIGPRVYGFSLDGEIVFDIHLKNVDYGGGNETPFITKNGNHQLVLTNGHRIYWLDSLGVFLDKKEYPDFEFRKILTVNDSTLVSLSASNIVVISSTGIIDTVIDVSSDVVDIVLSGDHVMAVTDSLFYHYDFSTEILTENAIQGNIIQAQGIFSYNDDYLLRGKGAGMNLLQQYHKDNLSLVKEVSFNQSNTVLKDFTVQENHLYIIGEDRALGKIQGFIKATPFFEEPIFSQENQIAIADFQVLQPLVVVDIGSVGEYIYEHPYLVYEYTIGNYSQDTINSFVVYSNEISGFNCVRIRYLKKFYNQTLLPNETITITDSLRSDYFLFHQSLNFVVYAPNHRFDGDASDNLIIPDNLVSTADHLTQDSYGFTVLPNPTSDVFNIYFKNANRKKDGTFRLINLQGQIISEFTADKNDITYMMKVRAFPVGSYFLQYVEDGILRSSQQVVISR